MPSPDSTTPKENPMPPTALANVKENVEHMIGHRLGADYVRHWRVLLSLWEQHPDRTASNGWIEWTLDAHMDAMKIPKGQRRKRAEEIYDALDRLARLETSVTTVTASGERWDSVPLITVVMSSGRAGKRFDRMTWMPILVQRAEDLDALERVGW